MCCHHSEENNRHPEAKGGRGDFGGGGGTRIGRRSLANLATTDQQTDQEVASNYHVETQNLCHFIHAPTLSKSSSSIQV